MIRIDTMSPADRQSVRAIYEEGIATGHATFETRSSDWDEWDRDHLPAGRFVARDGGEIIGWGALTPVSGRRVYRGVAEVTVYVAAAHRGRGVGRALLEAIIKSSEEAGLWTLQAGIFPENDASLALHRACGFRDVGVRERLGKLGDRWRDVALLERRSRRIGID
jgi:phosphinothricin acetyltransferase